MRWPVTSTANPPLVREIKKSAFLASLILLSLFVSAGIAKAQTQDHRPAPIASSELAQENMSHVAASPADIKAVLVKDAGLMVELKRWVAKDATDHGQVVGESDLTNDAIFDRLETDVRFRSVATRLLQKYGYLVPSVNPDSPLGKEQELLVQERVKWLTQQEEEDRTEERAKRRQELKDLQKARACAEGIETECTQRQHPLLCKLQGKQSAASPSSQACPRICLRSHLFRSTQTNRT